MNWLAALLMSAQASVVTPTSDHTCFHNCQIDQAGYEFFYTYEGFSPVIYLDSAGKQTIGVGHLIVKGEEFTRPLTPDEAEDLLKKDAAKAVYAVNHRVNVELKQNQFDALTSFTFNLGAAAFAGSTLLKDINEGQDDLIPGQFRRWCYSNHKPVTGLIRRRQAEASLYVG